MPKSRPPDFDFDRRRRSAKPGNGLYGDRQRRRRGDGVGRRLPAGPRTRSCPPVGLRRPRLTASPTRGWVAPRSSGCSPLRPLSPSLTTTFLRRTTTLRTMTSLTTTSPRRTTTLGTTSNRRVTPLSSSVTQPSLASATALQRFWPSVDPAYLNDFDTYDDTFHIRRTDNRLHYVNRQELISAVEGPLDAAWPTSPTARRPSHGVAFCPDTPGRAHEGGPGPKKTEVEHWRALSSRHAHHPRRGLRSVLCCLRRDAVFVGRAGFRSTRGAGSAQCER